MKKHLLMLAFASVATLASFGAAAATKLVVGASNVPHAEILEQAKPILAKEGIDLQIKRFQDYILPNTALAHSAMTTSVTSAGSAIGSPNIVSSLIKRCDCYQTVNRVTQGAGANLETAHISSLWRFFSMHTLQPWWPVLPRRSVNSVNPSA